MENKKNIGIWLDQRQAHVITTEGDVVEMQTISSEADEYHTHGGYGGSTPYASQDSVGDTKLQERKNHQLADYFKTIMKRVEKADALYIFGPGEAKTAFRKVLDGDLDLHTKVRAVETADSMTENQMKAQVREFFAKGIQIEEL